MDAVIAASRQLEMEMTRLTIWYGAISLVAAIVGAWVTYLVLKAAIRDGIRESGLTEWAARVTAAKTSDLSKDLPDMRADR